MRILPTALAVCALVAAGRLPAAIPAGPDAPAEAAAPAARPATLEPGRPAVIYLAPGRATTVLLRTDLKVAAISLASPVVTYRYDKALNQLELTPAVRSSGVETNLNLRIGTEVYVLLLRVVNDVRAEYVRTFVLAGGAEADEASLAGARPLAPAEIDLVTAAGIVQRAEADAVFRAAQTRLRIEALGQSYPWNDCAVRLDQVAQFLDLDLLVFRVRWRNATADALYLDPRQLSLWAAGRKIPIQARYSPDEGDTVWPGGGQTIYLAVQGNRLSRRNAWQLRLPPDAAALALTPRPMSSR